MEGVGQLATHGTTRVLDAAIEPRPPVVCKDRRTLLINIYRDRVRERERERGRERGREGAVEACPSVICNKPENMNKGAYQGQNHAVLKFAVQSRRCVFTRKGTASRRSIFRHTLLLKPNSHWARARKLKRKSFDVAWVRCEHPHSHQQVPFTRITVCVQCGFGLRVFENGH